MRLFDTLPSLSAIILLASTLALTGCAGFESAAPLPGVPTSISPGALHGSVFGGHAPIVGARVYLLQAGQGGYASAPTSRLFIGDGTDTLGTFVFTDLNGAFNITGEYTCDVGHPVYLAAVAGSPDTYPSFSITSIAATGSGTYTIVFTGNNLLYPGQIVNLAGLSIDASLNGNQQVTAATTSSFTISVTTSSTITSGPATGTATPLFANNPYVINLATLGLCPGTANQFADTISYVYMNEVSTVATAYAFAGFGAGPFLIGAPLTNLQGIKNAALNAAQLYDIQGGNVGGPADGDTHIARSVTPNGKATVPQSLLNTLGNILAACVDSLNPPLSASFACATLLNTARNTAGVAPTDTGTAAFNIAQNPAGYPGSTTSTWLSALYTLPPPNSPFMPTLGTQPTDFLVGLQYTAALNPSVITGPQSIATDAVGNFWYTTQPTGSTTSGYLVEANPLGLDLYSRLNSTFTYGNVTVDSNGNAWTGNNFAGYYAATEVVPGTPYTTYPAINQLTDANAAVADSAGNVYFGHGPNVTNGTVIHFAEFKADRSEAQDVDVSATFSGSSHIGHGAIDGNVGAVTGKLWLTSEDASIIAHITGSTGTNTPGFPITVSTHTATCDATSIAEPEQPAIDNAGKAWIPIYNSGAGSKVMIVTPAAGLLPTSCSFISTGAGPYGASIDGLSNVWVANRAGNSLTEINSTTGAILSPSTNFTVGGLLSGPQNLAIDISGDLFVTNFTGNSIVEVIGAAAPLYGPLGVAAGADRIASLP